MLIKSKGDPQYRHKLRKLDPKAHIGFLVGYESTNIYRVWVPHKKKVVSVRNVIFNEDEIWNGESIQYTADRIKKMDDAIKIVQASESEAEDIQLGEDLEEEVELAPAISHQNNHEAENLDANVNADEDETKDNDLAWAEGQYLTPNLSVFETFLANSVCLPVKTTDSSESERVDCSHENSFVATTATKKHEYCFLEPATMTQLEKQQNDRFYNYSQRQIPSKLQTAFVAGTHWQNLPPEPTNYRCLESHPLEKQFRNNIINKNTMAYQPGLQP